jgi:hypothetical protein
MATQADLDIVKNWIGDDAAVSDAELLAMVDSLGSPEAVAQSVLRKRRANLLQGAASVSATGYSENNTVNIEGLTKDIDELAIITGSGGVVEPVTSFRLVRPDRRCR